MPDTPDPAHKTGALSPDGAAVPSPGEQSRLNDLVGADDYEAGAEDVQEDTIERKPGTRDGTAPRP